MAEPYDAVVRAGGSARRLGGVDKPSLLVGDTSILDRVLRAVTGASRVVVVGPQRPTARDVVWCREEPPDGGPVAALAAGLAEVTAERVVLLAADLPFVTPDAVTALLDAMDGRHGALLIDHEGRDQLLAGAWRAESIRALLPETVDGARLAPVLLGLDPVRVRVEQRSGVAPPWFDCDTDDDLAAARGMA